ncbi:MAG: hypothetical protein PHF86_02255 [Candidatus Nanoarchaeia archaeon]|nr:hypothetical protein [Candidatus Nanoarchaeia archaeon]
MKLVRENIFEFQRGADPSEILELGRLQKTIDWLKPYLFRSSYSINQDWTIDIKKDFIVTNSMPNLEEFPEFIQFNICYGSFINRSHQFISMIGCPKIVYGDFLVDGNKLQVLTGCPKQVNGDFYIQDNDTKFTENEVRKICQIKGKLKV